MLRRSLQQRCPLLLLGGAVAVFLFALGHHAAELSTVGSIRWPVVAFLLDGVPALGLAYAGYRLWDSKFAPEDRYRICLWSAAGSGVFVGAIGITLLVRAVEGRTVAEPTFPLLVALNAGGIAGIVAGHYQVRARIAGRRARTASEALGFVNSLLRHDLRNDLNVIRGYGSELARGDVEDERRRGGDSGGSGDGSSDRRDASIVVEKADEALTRIETSSAIADSLSEDPTLEPIDLAAVVAELAARIENVYDVEVRTDLPDRALVSANRGIRSVVDNLLENAAEHNDADRPRIEVAVRETPTTVRLTVVDNGSGIPDDLKGGLFEADDASGTDERGGLLLVGRLLDAYGGDVRVEDNEPRGSRVVVDLVPAEAETT